MTDQQRFTNILNKKEFNEDDIKFLKEKKNLTDDDVYRFINSKQQNNEKQELLELFRKEPDMSELRKQDLKKLYNFDDATFNEIYQNSLNPKFITYLVAGAPIKDQPKVENFLSKFYT